MAFDRTTLLLALALCSIRLIQSWISSPLLVRQRSSVHFPRLSPIYGRKKKDTDQPIDFNDESNDIDSFLNDINNENNEEEPLPSNNEAINIDGNNVKKRKGRPRKILVDENKPFEETDSLTTFETKPIKSRSKPKNTMSDEIFNFDKDIEELETLFKDEPDTKIFCEDPMFKVTEEELQQALKSLSRRGGADDLYDREPNPDELMAMERGGNAKLSDEEQIILDNVLVEAGLKPRTSLTTNTTSSKMMTEDNKNKKNGAVKSSGRKLDFSAFDILDDDDIEPDDIDIFNDDMNNLDILDDDDDLDMNIPVMKGSSRNEQSIRGSESDYDHLILNEDDDNLTEEEDKEKEPDEESEWNGPYMKIPPRQQSLEEYKADWYYDEFRDIEEYDWNDPAVFESKRRRALRRRNDSRRWKESKSSSSSSSSDINLDYDYMEVYNQRYRDTYPTPEMAIQFLIKRYNYTPEEAESAKQITYEYLMFQHDQRYQLGFFEGENFNWTWEDEFTTKYIRQETLDAARLALPIVEQPVRKQEVIPKLVVVGHFTNTPIIKKLNLFAPSSPSSEVYSHQESLTELAVENPYKDNAALSEVCLKKNAYADTTQAPENFMEVAARFMVGVKRELVNKGINLEEIKFVMNATSFTNLVNLTEASPPDPLVNESEEDYQKRMDEFFQLQLVYELYMKHVNWEITNANEKASMDREELEAYEERMWMEEEANAGKRLSQSGSVDPEDETLADTFNYDLTGRFEGLTKAEWNLVIEHFDSLPEEEIYEAEDLNEDPDEADLLRPTFEIYCDGANPYHLVNGDDLMKNNEGELPWEFLLEEWSIKDTASMIAFALAEATEDSFSFNSLLSRLIVLSPIIVGGDLEIERGYEYDKDILRKFYEPGTHSILNTERRLRVEALRLNKVVTPVKYLV